jgi:glycosyltransferase involved in cell wall biosynthesis
MSMAPRVSVITPSCHQGALLNRTIESVLTQQYPNVEHIVVDRLSTDDTPHGLARYGHLRVVREPGKSQADALNEGFRVATGDILCLLNANDALMPGALDRVAREIDPQRGRHVIVGRCRLVDEHDRFVGIEHPSAFKGHRRVLEVWKGHCVPQSAVFWTAEAWQRCGPLNERDQALLDYDLLCRFSRDYGFHFVDQVLATYGIHTESDTGAATDPERLEQAVQVSRKYWGSPASLQRWQLELSYARYRFARQHRAMARLQRARESRRLGRYPHGLVSAAAGAVLAPEVAGDALIVPMLRSRVRPRLARAVAIVSARLRRRRKPSPHTLIWRAFEALHADRWAGPVWVSTVAVEPGHTWLELSASTEGFKMPVTLELSFSLDGRALGTQHATRQGAFAVRIPLDGVAAGQHELRVTANTYVTPYEYTGAEDHRPLSYKLKDLTLG